MVTKDFASNQQPDIITLLQALANMKAEWTEATGGKMKTVKVNLDLLFDDLETLIIGSSQKNNN